MGVAKCVCCHLRPGCAGARRKIAWEWPVMDVDVIVVGAGPTA